MSTPSSSTPDDNRTSRTKAGAVIFAVGSAIRSAAVLLAASPELAAKVAALGEVVLAIGGALAVWGGRDAIAKNGRGL